VDAHIQPTHTVQHSHTQAARTCSGHPAARPAHRLRAATPTPPGATPQPAPAEEVPARSAPLADPAPATLTFPAVIAFPDQPAPTTTTAAAPAFSPSQKAFLARKSAYLAGTGPLFPPESTCPACGGLGSHVCKGCGGTCVNPDGFVPPRGIVLEEARQFNGRVDVTTFLMPGGMCFSCMGRGTGACVICEGTGFSGGRMELFTGD
jgi:hypothetical protein